MTRAIHLSGLGGKPHRYWFFVPRYSHGEAPNNTEQSMREVCVWSRDQFGLGSVLATLKYRVYPRGVEIPRWCASLGESHIVFRDEVDATVFKIRWC